MRRTSLALLTAAGVASALTLTAPPAQAQPHGVMSYDTFSGICTQAIINQFGTVYCLRTNTRHEVETRGSDLSGSSTGCDCTGDVVGTWTDDGGHAHRTVWYYGYAQHNILISYKDVGGYWRAQTKASVAP